MPFSVIGVKGRLEGVEARLDEIQGEIRSLALRLPDPGRQELENGAPRARHTRLGRADDAPADPAGAPLGGVGPGANRPNRRVDPTRGARAEPRFDPR